MPSAVLPRRDLRACVVYYARRASRLSLILWVAAASTACAAAPRRLPVPDKPAQEKAFTQVREVFAEDFTRAKGSAEKLSALAATLLEQAAQSPQPSTRYVLLQIAADTAVRAADVAAAMKAVEELEKNFQVDAAAMKLDTLKALAHSARTPLASAALVEQLERLVDEQIAADQYPAALEAARMAVDEIRKGRDAAARKRAVGQLSRTEETAQAYDELKQSLDLLARTLDDPAANSAVGKFFCLTKGDWKKGLPMLARGDDRPLRDLARAELQSEKRAGDANPQPPMPNVLSLADAWWDLAEKEQGRPREQLRAHAVACYRLALAKLTGLDKTRVERRVAEASQPATHEEPRPAAKPIRRPSSKVRIIQALYGKPRHAVDVTAAVQTAVAKDPYLPLRVDMYLNGGIDPAPNQHKTLILRYQIGRTLVDRLLHEGTVETIPPMPKAGVPLAEAADQFTVLAGRYGSGVTWLDVTSNVAGLVSDPAAAFNFDAKKVADDQTRKSCHALVVWFDYQGRRYVRVFEHTRKCLLLPP